MFCPERVLSIPVSEDLQAGMHVNASMCPLSLCRRKRSQRPSDRDTHWAWQDTPWDTRLEPGGSARLPHLIHIKAGTGDKEEDDTEMHK